jgi:hypothetical protein
MGALSESVTRVTAGTDPRDRATADLALVYAREIDEGGDLTKLGPALLAALEALQLSPRARKAVKIDDKPAVNPLDQLAAARARKGGAASLDAAVP